MLLLPERSITTLNHIHHVDALTLLRALPNNFVNCIVTSPPYFGLRVYLAKDHPDKQKEIGAEQTPQALISRLMVIFNEVKRVLRDDGVCWVNIGDTYSTPKVGNTLPAGFEGDRQNQQNRVNTTAFVKPRLEGVASKNLLMIPARFAIAMQDSGWILRSECVWVKPNPMPESVTDRPTKSHEMVYLFSKSPRYAYDAEAIKEDCTAESGGGWSEAYAKAQPAHGAMRTARPLVQKRNRRDVFTIATEPTPYAHFATFPQKLIEPLILAGCPAGGIVLDPFMGSGTTGLVARRLGRQYIGSELNPEYVRIARERLRLPFDAHHIKQETQVDDLPLFAKI